MEEQGTARALVPETTTDVAVPPVPAEAAAPAYDANEGVRQTLREGIKSGADGFIGSRRFPW